MAAPDWSRLLTLLAEFIAIPTVSSDPACVQDMQPAIRRDRTSAPVCGFGAVRRRISAGGPMRAQVGGQLTLQMGLASHQLRGDITFTRSSGFSASGVALLSLHQLLLYPPTACEHIRERVVPSLP